MLHWQYYWWERWRDVFDMRDVASLSNQLKVNCSHWWWPPNVSRCVLMLDATQKRFLWSRSKRSFWRFCHSRSEYVASCSEYVASCSKADKIWLIFFLKRRLIATINDEIIDTVNQWDLSFLLRKEILVFFLVSFASIVYPHCSDSAARSFELIQATTCRYLQFFRSNLP